MWNIFTLFYGPFINYSFLPKLFLTVISLLSMIIVSNKFGIILKILINRLFRSTRLGPFFTLFILHLFSHWIGFNSSTDCSIDDDFISTWQFNIYFLPLCHLLLMIYFLVVLGVLVAVLGVELFCTVYVEYVGARLTEVVLISFPTFNSLRLVWRCICHSNLLTIFINKLYNHII